MPNDPTESTRSYVARVFTSDPVKKGLAGAAAGLLIAAISEALWPTS